MAKACERFAMIPPKFTAIPIAVPVSVVVAISRLPGTRSG